MTLKSEEFQLLQSFLLSILISARFDIESGKIYGYFYIFISMLFNVYDATIKRMKKEIFKNSIETNTFRK